MHLKQLLLIFYHLTTLPSLSSLRLIIYYRDIISVFKLISKKIMNCKSF